jgi:hypothetical protein
MKTCLTNFPLLCFWNERLWGKGVNSSEFIRMLHHCENGGIYGALYDIATARNCMEVKR